MERLFRANRHARAAHNVHATASLIFDKGAHVHAAALAVTFGFVVAFTASCTHAPSSVAPAQPPAPAVSKPTKLALESYETLRADSIILQYPAAEETFAQEIRQGFSFPMRLRETADFDAQIAQWQKHDLPLIAKYLGLAKPTEAMDAVYSDFRMFCLPVVQQRIGAIRIYYTEDLRAALKSGAQVEGVFYNANDDTFAVANAITMAHDGPPAPLAPDLPPPAPPRVLPLIFSATQASDDEGKTRLLNNTLRDMRWQLDEIVYNVYCSRLYGLVVPEIGASISNARVRLWPLEGMANAIPLLVLRSHSPSLSFEQLLQMYSAPPAGFAKRAQSIELDKGPTPIDQSPEAQKAANDAYMYLTMLVMLEAVDDNGDEWLPKFFDGLRAENDASLSPLKVYVLFHELTDKNLSDYTRRVKTRLAEQP